MLFKKIKTILASGLIAVGVASSCLVISSCDNGGGGDTAYDQDTDPRLSGEDDAICQYAFDRTFSIAATNGERWVRGTGWIYKRDTPTIDQNYRYYLMTNWHVAYDFEHLDIPGNVIYGISYLDSVDKNGIGYRFDSSKYKWANGIDDFYFTTPAWNAQRAVVSQTLYGVDASMYKINLKGLALQDSYLKHRLDEINSAASADGSLLTFKTSEYTSVPTTPFYLVGYPSVGENAATTRLTKRKNFMERDGIFNNYPNRQSHWIHPNVVQSVADCYRFQEGYFNLRGGSSGSMILNSDKEVVGIYWGTVTYLDSGKVYGTADILKSAQYDVINCANNDTQLS